MKQLPCLLLRLITKAKNVTPIVRKHVAKKKEKTKKVVKLIVKSLVAPKRKKKPNYCQRNVSSIFCTSFLMYPMAGAKES